MAYDKAAYDGAVYELLHERGIEPVIQNRALWKQDPVAEICNAGKSYGKTVRIKQEEDLRRLPPIPRATKQFERLYKGPTAVERVNGRVKIYWGADDGNLVGATRFHAFLGTVMVIHAALATVLASLPRREGTLGTMKLSPIAAALQAQRAAPPVAAPA